MREILSHFQYLSPAQLWECRGTPHALHERWGVELTITSPQITVLDDAMKSLPRNTVRLGHYFF